MNKIHITSSSYGIASLSTQLGVELNRYAVGGVGFQAVSDSIVR